MHSSLGRGRSRAGHHLIALVAALLCGLALAACGSDDSDSGSSDEDQVREVAEQLSSNDPAACGKLTEDFLKQLGSKEECEKSAEEPDEGPQPEVGEVKVDGETATAVVVDEDRSTLKFVKQDGEWLVDGVEVEEGAGAESGSGTSGATETDAADSSAGGDEVEARAAVDAFLIGVEDEDPQVLCGLFSEKYAKELTGASEFGIAECVEQLRGSGFGELKKSLKGIEVTKTTVAEGGRAATVKLSNGNAVKLAYQDGRFVIDEL